MWDNVWLLAFLIWPAVIIGAALLNMLVSWTFSWSELVMDYLSFFIWILKAPFTMITPGVGLLVGLIGLIVGAINHNLGFGFLGGIFYFKWGLSGGHATLGGV